MRGWKHHEDDTHKTLVCKFTHTEPHTHTGIHIHTDAHKHTLTQTHTGVRSEHGVGQLLSLPSVSQEGEHWLGVVDICVRGYIKQIVTEHMLGSSLRRRDSCPLFVQENVCNV